MDPVNTALTNAWLSAVARLHTPANDLPPRVGPPQSLTDAIEDALRRENGGGRADVGHVVDRVA